MPRPTAALGDPSPFARARRGCRRTLGALRGPQGERPRRARGDFARGHGGADGRRDLRLCCLAAPRWLGLSCRQATAAARQLVVLPWAVLPSALPAGHLEPGTPRRRSPRLGPRGQVAPPVVSQVVSPGPASAALRWWHPRQLPSCAEPVASWGHPFAAPAQRARRVRRGRPPPLPSQACAACAKAAQRAVRR